MATASSRSVHVHAAPEWGIDQVPRELRVLGFLDQAVLWGNLGISLLVLVAGALLVPALGLWQALAATVLGAAVGNALLGLAAVPAAETPGTVAGPPTALLAGLDTEGIRSRFLDIQAGFVDEPRQAVEEAGRFAEELVQQVIDALQAQRGQLHAPVDEGSTEDLRLALRSYRQFVDRLLGLAM